MPQLYDKDPPDEITGYMLLTKDLQTQLAALQEWKEKVNVFLHQIGNADWADLPGYALFPDSAMNSLDSISAKAQALLEAP